MRTNSRSIMISLVALAAWIAWPSAASAQVVIDMPPPPKKKYQPSPLLPAGPDEATTTVKTSTSTTNASAMYPVSVEQYDVGDVALARYSGARYGTYDTYYSDSMYPYNGTHYYPRYYPQYVWGWPWWGWGFWPGFSFGFHCH